MSVVAVVGAQWGDEGKGRVIDLLAAKARLVARYQGGSNAGHTVINDLGTFKLHLVPAGIFNPEVVCVVGAGVVVDPRALLAEIAELTARGVSVDKLFVSDRAHVVLSYHMLLDRLEEESRGADQIGTTGRGIGPAYVDKVARIGIRMCDLLDPSAFRAKLRANLAQKNPIVTKVYGAEPLDEASIFDEYLAYGERLARHIVDTGLVVQDAVERGDNVLLEGGQGTLLDLDHGTYPFVTSSSPLAGGGCAGAGLGPTRVDRSVGVFKAYVTRVGAGPFPTELTDEHGERLRERGGEFGTTTGRARRCGWFDAVLARYSARLNGFDAAVLTKLDVLDAEPVLRICTGYRLDGEIVRSVPASLTALGRCEPVYEELPGWRESTAGARTLAELPLAARRYVERLEALIGCPIEVISVGPSREQRIVLAEPFR